MNPNKLSSLFVMPSHTCPSVGWGKAGIQFFFVLYILLSSFSPFLQASPWIGTDDRWLRSDIEFLADSKIISVPITTWPLMWKGVIRDLEEVEPEVLSGFELQAYRRVRSAFRIASREDMHAFFAVRAATAEREFIHFGDVQREKLEATLGVAGIGGRFAYILQGTYVDDPKDKREKRWDGSFISALLGNWSVTVGAIPYWWGPEWGSSLILSNNARPFPAIILQRNESEPFEWPMLQWIGPWHFVTFLGRLEKDRTPAHSLFFGMRTTLKPIASLELGASRVIHWGGRGRNNSPRQLWGAFFSSAGEDRSKENTNSLAGIDFRWGSNPWQHPLSFYGHYMIEDGGNPRRGKYFWMVGGSLQGFSLWEQSLGFWVEWTDTMAHKANTRIRRQNIAYEHGAYQPGHRYRQRSLGSTYDNDSNIAALGSLLQFKNAHQFGLQMEYLNLNRDDVNNPLPGGSRIASREQKIFRGILNYRIPLLLGDLQFNAEYKTEELTGVLKNGEKWLFGFEFSKML